MYPRDLTQHNQSHELNSTRAQLRALFNDRNFGELVANFTFFSGTSLSGVISHFFRTGALHDINYFKAGFPFFFSLFFAFPCYFRSRPSLNPF